MKVQNKTPFLVGSKVTSRRPPQPEMTLVVRGAFALRPGQPIAPLDNQGALTAEIFQPDDDDRRGECLYPGDFADFKLNAEVMLHGTCFPPARRPVTESMVRFAVGTWSKFLRVVGPRAWSDRLAGAVPSDPLPFKQMSLDYGQSFGGPGYAKNPVGKGFETDVLPCIESPVEPVRTRRDRPEPAGFGPINPSWPQRAAKIGKEYGRSYREKRAPYYAEDFDWAYFHAAPPDQQIKGYLRGDEDVVLQGLYPDAPSFSARLPGLRIRAFVKDVRGRFREVSMSLDTLFADTDAGALHLTWRGVDAVVEDDLTDVAIVRVASEPMTEAPLPVERHRTELEAFEADPLGFRSVLPPALVELAERSAAEHRGDASPDEAEVGSAARIPRLVEGFLSRLPGTPPDQVNAMADSVSAPTDGLRAALLEVANSGRSGAPAPPLVPLKPGSMPVVKVGPSMRALQAQIETIKQQAAERGQTVTGLEKVDAVVNHPQLQQIDPTFKPPRPDDPPPEEPGPGRSLSGLDFTGRDLHGRDLTGANLEGAILTRANLRNAILAGANLAYAVLYEADLAGADFTGADLTKAQVAQASAIGARFDRAIVEQASFEKADLTGASLLGTKGTYVRFSKANLSRAKAAGCSLTNTHFDGARLEQADFTGALLASCLLRDAHARGVILAKATLTRASFEKADLRGAILTGAKGDKIAWMGAKLDDADLRYAWMTGCFFMEVSANRATFLEANLKEGRFYKAAMESASFVRANLFAADFRKATLSGASFSGANLYNSKFIGAAGKGCDFSGANLKRSTLETQG